MLPLREFFDHGSIYTRITMERESEDKGAPWGGGNILLLLSLVISQRHEYKHVLFGKSRIL